MVNPLIFLTPPILLSITFYLSGSLNKSDLDNLIGGIKDALIGYAWVDDSCKYVREYGNMKAVSLCYTCQDKKTCKKIKDCPYERVEIEIKEIGGENEKKNGKRN